MSQHAQIRIRYNPSRTYPGTAQLNFPGAQTVVGRRGTLPTFTDANTRYFAKAGSDTTGTGTFAAPFATVTKATSMLTGAFVYAVCKDSGVYEENPVVINFTGVLAAGGLYALDGFAPTIKVARGVIEDSFGARATGRTHFSTGGPTTFLYVSKAGNDGTGTRGNPAFPFLTIQGALNAGARVANDTVQIQDSGLYVEALNAAALAVTIQAAAGQIPTLWPTGGGSHITANAGVRVDLYGLLIRDGLTQPAIVTLTGSSSFYDCTFIGGLNQLNLSGGAQTFTIVNCLMTESQNQAIIANLPSATTFVVTNCLFMECTNSLPESVVLVLGASSLSTFTFTRCTFRNGNAGVSYIGVRGNTPAGVAPTVTMNVASCVFEDTRPHPSTAAAFSTTVGVKGGWTITNCLFSRLGGPVLNDTTTVAGTATFVLVGSAAIYCSSLTPTLADVLLASSFTSVGSFILNCVFVGSKFAGIQASNSFGGIGGMVNCAFLNCGSYAYRGLAGLPTMRSCVEANSGVQSATSVTAQYSVFKTAGTINAGSGVRFLTDPMFLATAAGVENTGLSAASPAVNANLSGFDHVNMGPVNPTIFLATASLPFTIDGFNIEGDKYFTDGIQITAGYQGPAGSIVISHCSFRGLAGQAIIAARSSVLNCLGDGLNGQMINMGESGGSILRCVGTNGGGAFIILGSPVQSVNHCTAYGNEYGQFDQGQLSALTLKNNVYCGNGILDYSGHGTQTTSVICRISDDATVTGSASDPMFRDTSLPDVRLQTVETGFQFDSPAKLLADDGTDAGAYQFTYGGLVLTWTLVDFATGAGNPDLAYRNPSHLSRIVQPLKLSEGETFGGITFSVAPQFKTEHHLQWDGDTNMPAAQVADLVLIYTTGDGECEISFNAGVSFIPVRLLRSTTLERTELDEAYYSDDSIPTPVREMHFREST